MKHICVCRCDIDVQLTEPPQCTNRITTANHQCATTVQTTTGVDHYRAPSGVPLVVRRPFGGTGPCSGRQPLGEPLWWLRPLQEAYHYRR